MRQSIGSRAMTAARCMGLMALLLPAACSHHLSAAQIAVLKQEGFQPKSDDWELNLSDKMLFTTGSDQLQEPTRQAIERTGKALKAVDIRNVRVEGHTDNVGTDAYNLALSQRRAETVAASLSKDGLAGPIGRKGLGKQYPVADNGTEAGRAENRRVSVIVPDDQK